MAKTYSHLTNDEFLLSIDDKRYQSPVIKELCRRLEQADAETAIREDANHRAECPVCEAGLLVEYDDGNGLFDLKVDPDA